MKKHAFLAAYLLLCGSFLSAELTKAQFWAISLPGILTEARGGYRNSLNDMAMNESGRNGVLTTLSRDWGITTREELLETLDSLEDGGHPAALREIKDIINEIIKAGNNESVINAILSKVQWDQVKWVRFRYVFNNWDKYQNVTLKAWDLGRSVSLCRWGYNVGFLTEAEAWKRIFHIAGLVQPLFNSWEEFGYDYYMGRLFWAASSGNEVTYQRTTEPIYRRLLDSYWGLLEWDIDLDAEEEEVPIIPRRFAPPDDNDGTMQYLTNDPAMYSRSSWNRTPVPNLDTVPVVYELRAKKLSGNGTSGFGMSFCLNDQVNAESSYYRLLITVDGRFTVQKIIANGSAPAPVSWRDSQYLETGFGVYNTLRVERTDSINGAAFRVFINGNLAATFIDDDPINGVNFAPIVSVGAMEREQFPHIPVDVRFEY